MSVGDCLLGVNWRANSQVSVAMGVFADGALDGLLRRSLGSSSVWTEGSSEVDDVSSRNIVDET